jgi:hypothetical protein
LDKINFTLGDESYEVRELTLGQLEELQDLLVNKATHAGGSLFNKNANREIIAIALSADYPQVTSESLKTVRMNVRRLDEIVRKILRLGGFTVPDSDEKPKEKPEGEAQAG